MMATTHGFVGAAAALVLAFLAPEQMPLIVGMGFAGGLFPDLDLYAGHRRTLHFPVYFSVWAAVLLLVALAFTSPVTVAVAAFGVAAAIHSVMDIFGGGLELRPWEGTSDRAVYNHALGRWHAPRRMIRYDGAPEDFLVGLVFAVPVVLTVDGTLREVIVGALALSAGYAMVRKVLPSLAEAIVEFTPAAVLTYIPERFLGGSDVFGE